MSSVPGEVLRDILLPLDRWTLDAVQCVDRRFQRLVMNRMADVCLRQVYLASFRAPSVIGDGTSSIHIDGPPERTISRAHKDTAHLFSEFVKALRSCRVSFLTIIGLVFTPEFATLVSQTPIFCDALTLAEGSCADLTPAQFSDLLRHFSPTTLDVNTCQLRACQLSDELLRALSKSRVRRCKFQNLVPVDGGSFHVTDDAVVDFCVQQDVCDGQDEDAEPELYGELVVSNGTFTKDLVRRLVEASAASLRRQPLRIVVSPLRIEDDDLRDFVQQLSYCHRGQPNEMRLYDFPGDPRTAIPAMHLQIALRSAQNRLELFRAQRPNIFFYESDE